MGESFLRLNVMSLLCAVTGAFWRRKIADEHQHSTYTATTATKNIENSTATSANPIVAGMANDFELVCMDLSQSHGETGDEFYARVWLAYSIGGRNSRFPEEEKEYVSTTRMPNVVHQPNASLLAAEHRRQKKYKFITKREMGFR